MLNESGVRELVYVVKVDSIHPITGKDRVECAMIGGWSCMVPKGAFQPETLGIYFETDSKVDETKPEFAFTAKYKGKIKIQRFKTPDGPFYSQGLLMKAEDLGWVTHDDCIEDDKNGLHFVEGSTKFLTNQLNVTYATAEDNVRKSGKSDPNAKYKSMMARHPKLAKSNFGRWCMKHELAKKILYLFLGNKKKDTSKEWPVGKFPGVTKTDQERVENMPWVLDDKTPFIVTQKCDGSSGTYILEKKGHNKYEFYVCSRNVRLKDEDQECFYGEHNYYWEVANKYDIRNKMQDWLDRRPERQWVCWQGEICAPGIQGNPHGLTKTHFFCFHWTDNVSGRWDIRDAATLWNDYDMEVVPIIGEEVLPDDMEIFKLEADGFYSPTVCEGKCHQAREGFVYYKTNDPTFSFKNRSREYLAKHSN